MSDNHSDNSSDQVRPVLLADRRTLRYYSTSLRHIFAGMSEELCQCALVCPPDVDAESVACMPTEIIPYPVFKSRMFWFQNRRAVLDEIGKFKPTVLHCLSAKQMRLTEYLAGQLGVPYVVSFNSAAISRLGLATSRNCAAMIASSGTIAKKLTKISRRRADRIHQINIGTFVEDTCACFSVGGRVMSMVVAQRLENAFEFEPLLNAVRHLVIDGYEFVLAIIGKGPAERGIHKMIKELGISHSVTVVPAIEPMQSVFAGADIFIQPHISMSFNPYLLDAMSVGMVVASCRAGIEDFLVEGETAVFFETDDELSIYSCLQKLMDKREVARQIAMGAQSRLRKNHSVSKMVSSLLEIYRSVGQRHKETQS
ncbi:MAG TPA: glycosyltransferase [Phycisphaerales bacterium]|nr:glycosyltransferase [Phycisphaerales bacterium]